MKRGIQALLLVGALLALAGCSSLLERSYGEVEPYADRYWDSGAEDTLRAETYQDLVNSLLMLVEQRADTGTIRCYGEASSYASASAAAREVRGETMLGAYLLRSMYFTYGDTVAAGYSTFTYHMTYREDAEDVGAMMTLSDSQSLVDLLRLAVREGHDRLTARFSYYMPRDVVTAAVESMWEELCQDEMDRQPPEGEDVPPEEPPEDGAPADPEAPPEEDTDPEDPEGPEEEPPPVYPPCPWTVRFYPDMERAELVEILLTAP